MRKENIRPSSEIANFSWNAIGSAANTIPSLILLMIVTQILGKVAAAPFAIAFTTAQILLAVGLYGIRNYQVTDISDMYSTGVYISSRTITSLGMIVIGLLYCLVSRYDITKTALFFVLIISKMSESISDVFYGIMQKKGKLYIAGISMSVRTVITVLLFYFSLSAFHNLLLSSALLAAAGYIPILLIDLPVSRRMDSTKPLFDKQKIINLLRICFPIFAASIMPIIVINLPKYVIERTMADEFQTIYNIIVMPGTAIVLFSQIIVQSFLVKLAYYRSKALMSRFVGLISAVILMVGLFTGLWMVLLNFWGRDLLLLLYGLELGSYIPQLLIVLVGAMLCSIAIIFSVALTTLRVTKIQLYLFVINLVSALAISVYLIPRFGLSGAANSYLLIMLIQVLLYAVVFAREIYRLKKYPGELA